MFCSCQITHWGHILTSCYWKSGSMAYFHQTLDRFRKHLKSCNFFLVLIWEEVAYRAIDDLVWGCAEPKSLGEIFRKKKVTGYSSEIKFSRPHNFIQKDPLKKFNVLNRLTFLVFVWDFGLLSTFKTKIWQKMWFLTLSFLGSHLVTTGHMLHNWSHPLMVTSGHS